MSAFRQRHFTLRLLLWIVAIDLCVAIPSGVSLIEHRIANPIPVAVLMGLRMALWAVDVVRLLAPVRAWLRRRHGVSMVDERTLLAADASLQGSARRFMADYIIGWILCIVLAAVLSPGLVSTPAQQSAIMLQIVSIMLATPAFLVPVFRHVFFDVHSSLAEVLRARSLQPPRPRLPLAMGLTTVLLGLFSATMFGLTSSVSWYRAEGRLNVALATQQHHAELDALRVETGGALSEGSQLLAAEALPAALGESTTSDAPRVFYDVSNEQIIAAAPVGDGRWVLHTEPYDDDSWRVVPLWFIGATMCLLPGLLASIALNRGLVGPLRRVDRAARQVAELGRLRAQGRVDALHNDELGDLANSFNVMLDVLAELAVAASKVAEGDLQVTLERPGDLQDAFRAMISKLDEVVVQIRATALEVAAAAAEIHAATQEQEQAVEQQSTSLRQVGATVGSLSASAESITTAAKGVLANAEQTRATTDLMARRIADLSAQASGISELLELIREVADRSDLLALNGSLEAVRAGEAGRGFALVAAEMRRLAERVTGTVGDVSVQVGNIQNASAGTVMATEESRSLAEHTAEAARRISNETQQQSLDTEQLAIAVHEVAEVTAATSEATTQTRATAEGLRIHAEQLEQLTRQFKLQGDR